MFSRFYLLLAFFLAATLPSLAAPIQVYPTVRWVTSFGSSLPSDTVVDLAWEGGSDKGYEVYYIPQWAGQMDYAVRPFGMDDS